ncbi:MAG: DNA mismatch repair endonuclease MutL [Lachnospiraceae bacterium]
MNTIQVLSHETIDKIAAGEVVERPASIVKELVENAMDAGATAITVEIKEGGISLIRVTDNGSGIEKDQIRLAFTRHATSKISSIDDMFTCRSLGFRGEALSSIAAVSMVEFISKTPSALTGTRYVQEGAIEQLLEDIGAPNGTTMIVRNLFFNTPPRRQFLKTAPTEGSYITDLMEHMAMSRPEVSIKYVNNNQEKFHTSGNGNLYEILYRIYGKDAATELIPLMYEGEEVNIQGFIGKPTFTRSNRNYETYFVNHRFIKSDEIAKAIEEGYHPYLMQHKFPFVVLNLTVDTNKLDVNVHPSKLEVKFANQNMIYQSIVTAVSDTLHATNLIPQVAPGAKPHTPEEPIIEKRPEPFEVNRLQESQVREESIYSAKKEELQDFLQKTGLHKILGMENSAEVPKNVLKASNVIKPTESIIVEKPMQLHLFEDKLLTKEAQNQYHILGQIFDTYWLVVFSDKLFIVDQHAAHEKVKYESLKKKMSQKEILTQALNPPVILTFSGREETVFLQCKESFSSLGFEIESFGGDAYTLRGVPIDLYGCNEQQLFQEILDELMNNDCKQTPAVIEDKLASMACKAAVKGNHAMTEKEFGELLNQLLELDNPYHCPHGRPTIISMSRYEIEKKFKRIV